MHREVFRSERNEANGVSDSHTKSKFMMFVSAEYCYVSET